jgi:NAD(P)H-flavin reductase
MNSSAADINTKMLDPMIPVPVRVQKLVWETDDVYTLYLKPNSEFNNEFKFSPGQFNMLYTFGKGESAISISSNPFKPGTLIHTIHNVGNVTSALSRLKRGDYVGVRGPFGSCWPVEEAIGKDVCIMAGGIGLPPLRPVIYTILKNRKDYGKVFILYGARSPRDLLFRVELEKWGKQFDFEVLVTVDHSDSSWKGHVGVVTGLLNYVQLDKYNSNGMRSRNYDEILY